MRRGELKRVISEIVEAGVFAKTHSRMGAALRFLAEAPELFDVLIIDGKLR
jgi:hypothetical protein